MNTKSSIFTTSDIRENTAFGVHLVKKNVPLKKSHFLFLLSFKIAMIDLLPTFQPSGQTTFFLAFYVTVDASSVFTCHDIDCIRGLRLKNSLKTTFK